MAITKILNIQESESRNPVTHLKNALEYIQNPDKTEKCVLVGSINCLPDTAFEQMEETKNIFHKTGKRQGYHVIISFSPEEKVTAEQAMYVLEHFAKDVLGDDYEAVYAVHTDREHMHGHLIWNSVSVTTGKKYNSPKSNWKNHLQPITNKYCDELGLSIMPAEYSRNPKNISRDKWEREMSMKEIILRDAKMCAYAAGNVEHFKYLMKRLGYVFKIDAWMEVQAPGFKYYHKLAKLDEMFSEETLRHHVDMPWMAKPYFYSSDIRGLHRAKLSPYQKKFYAKLYRLRIVEQKRFVVGGAKYAEDLKRFHRLQDEYLLLVNNDIKSVVELVDFIGEQEEKIQQIDDRQKEIYRESSSRKRSIKNEEQYREYQIWHVEVQEELDELKQEKRNVKRQIQLADDIIKEDLYTVYYVVSEKEEIVADRDVEIPGMEEDTEVEKATAAVVEPDRKVGVMNPNNNQNEIGRQKEQADRARKQQSDLDGMLDLIHRFISFVKEKEEVVKNGVTKTVMKEKMIFPRYHQYDVVKKIMADVKANGVGNNYLIQHSAGSGKSNSIAWIAYRLASVHDADNKGLFDSVIVVTNRVVLDGQLQDTINSFEHQVGLVEAIDDKKNSRSLAEAINDKRRIIICTIQKFLFAKKDMEKFRGRKFAVIIDEAHQGQNGESAKTLRRSLIDIGAAIKEYAEKAGIEEDEVDLTDEYISAVIGQGRHDNQSFFAFTATPKQQTIETFGTVVGVNENGESIRVPFHVYSMRQAIEEGYILDVLANYTTVKEAFKLIKVSEDNPELIEGPTSRALFKYYKKHGYTIAQKTEMIMTNFLENCRYQINGKGKAMVVADSRANAVRYYLAIRNYIREHEAECAGSDVMIAFSGEVTLEDYPSEKPFTEATMNVDENGKYITTDKKFRKVFHSSQYNILVVANKYQTGFDEPLLHTMYVDKKLHDVTAVQTLSRLNRTTSGKNSTFVLDFENTEEDIKGAFLPYYEDTTMEGDTDINAAYDIRNKIHDYMIYNYDDVDVFNKFMVSNVGKNQDAAALGRLAGMFRPVIQRYKDLDEDDREASRDYIRR